jgi:hypothetical protein
MIAPIEHVAGEKKTCLFQLKVTLEGIRPSIWRRLQVPGEANLGWLHAVLQVAMGWTNSHLHQFHIGNQTCSDPAFELNELEDDPPVLDERKTILRNVAPRAGHMLGYEYDFGDSWEHAIVVEQVLSSSDPVASKTAICLEGARACPPEDCGSVTGYAKLLKVLRNPKHKEHKAMKEWLGSPFDPEAFDAAAVNVWLRRLRWPRVTEGLLRKVLMARDGYQE